MGWMAAAQIGGSLIDSWIGASSAHKANQTNIKLQRKQQEWEERMANTAIQRRKNDFVAAGFNPVLAATGVGAATPSLAPPTVQPEWSKGIGASAALAQAATIKNVNANTAAQLAEARIKNVEADIREASKPSELELRVNRNVEEYEWNNLKTKILRSAAVSSAADAERAEKTVEALIQSAKQQARAGQIDLEALENIARLGGVEASKTSWIIRLIKDIFISERKLD